MTKKELEELHQACSDALNRYWFAAVALCVMLEDSAGIESSHREDIADRRLRERLLHDEYQQIRARLLEAAETRFGQTA